MLYFWKNSYNFIKYGVFKDFIRFYTIFKNKLKKIIAYYVNYTFYKFTISLIVKIMTIQEHVFWCILVIFGFCTWTDRRTW